VRPRLRLLDDDTLLARSLDEARHVLATVGVAVPNDAAAALTSRCRSSASSPP
jgi:hypothetical protein